QKATASPIEEYARRWWIWVRSGVLKVELPEEGNGAIAPLPFYPTAKVLLP
ncbi:MAG: hypothetical protein F6K20_36710, partial [Moorea sp. SIO2C4]|nr:hypothetical protein [Moorena sp. SIO2C4]